MATRTFQAGEMVRKTTPAEATLQDVLADGPAGPRMPASVRAEALPSSTPSGSSPPPPLTAGFVSKTPRFVLYNVTRDRYYRTKGVYAFSLPSFFSLKKKNEEIHYPYNKAVVSASTLHRVPSHYDLSSYNRQHRTHYHSSSYV